LNYHFRSNFIDSGDAADPDSSHSPTGWEVSPPMAVRQGTHRITEIAWFQDLKGEISEGQIPGPRPEMLHMD
jgi:hypothetical protein